MLYFSIRKDVVMSKALQEVMQYANEDVASIRKHWIVFVYMVRRIIIFALIIMFLNIKATKLLGGIGDFINNKIPSFPFVIREHLILLGIILILLYAVVQFISTYVMYKTVGLTVNNIQIKGTSGLVEIGQVNSSLEQIGYVKTDISLLGRILKYGSIEITLHDATFTMNAMTEVEKFQEAIILLQEAQKEGRTLRSDERQDESRMNAAIMQTQAMAMLNQTISQALPGTNNQAIESSEQELIEQIAE